MENALCQKEFWSFMHLLCRGMVALLCGDFIGISLNRIKTLVQIHREQLNMIIQKGFANYFLIDIRLMK